MPPFFCSFLPKRKSLIDKTRYWNYDDFTLQKEQFYFSKGCSSQLSNDENFIWKGGMIGKKSLFYF